MARCRELYQRMFRQIEEMDRLGYDHVWVTEHHFAMYGGTLPHPPTFHVGRRAHDEGAFGWVSQSTSCHYTIRSRSRSLTRWWTLSRMGVWILA